MFFQQPKENQKSVIGVVISLKNKSMKLYIAGLVIVAAVWIAIAYVAIHFIVKFW